MAATRPSGLNRKQRKALARRLQAADPGLDVIHPPRASTSATARTTSPFDPIAMPIPCGGLSASPRISIVWPIGSSTVA